MLERNRPFRRVALRSRKDSSRSINRNAIWLLRMTENILSVTRFGSDGVVLEKTDELALTGRYQVGSLVIDYKKHRVYLDGADTRLTPNKYKIVALLGRHAGQVLTYKFMMKELWGPSVGSDNKLLRVHMANIRRKIEPNPLEPRYVFTEVGVGYRMADESE